MHLAVALLLLLPLGSARASDLDALLQRGPVAHVETRPDGSLERIVAYADTPAPPDRVWACLTAFDTYTEWMPGVARVKETRREGGLVEHDWVLAVPGPNVRFSTRFHLDPPTRTIRGSATSKNLGGSTWSWRLEARPGGGTRIVRTSRSTGITDNWLLEMLGEHKDLLDLGINLASPVVEVEAVRERCR